MGKRNWIKDDRKIISFAEENDDILNKGVYKNLMLQVNKIAKHAKGVSITSQRQYYNHMDHFVRFLSDNFGVKSLRNISGKHLASFIEERQFEAVSPSTVKNDLAAIRYYHNQMEDTRNFLPTNGELSKLYGVSLDRRMFGGVNRRWHDTEYENMLSLADSLKQSQIRYMLILGREQGLRIHETVRLSRTDAERALRDGKLKVKGKGGLIRYVPLTENSRNVFIHVIKNVARGNKLFVPCDKKAHEIIQSIQGFIQRHRCKRAH